MSKKVWVLVLLVLSLVIVSRALIAIPLPPALPGAENTSNSYHNDYVDPVANIGDNLDNTNADANSDTLLDSNNNDINKQLSSSNQSKSFFRNPKTIILFVLTILVIICIIVFIWLKKTKIKEDLLEKNIITSLRNYVASCRFKGYKDESIRIQLVKSGYDHKIIEKALEKVLR